MTSVCTPSFRCRAHPITVSKATWVLQHSAEFVYNTSQAASTSKVWRRSSSSSSSSLGSNDPKLMELAQHIIHTRTLDPGPPSGSPLWRFVFGLTRPRAICYTDAASRAAQASVIFGCSSVSLLAQFNPCDLLWAISSTKFRIPDDAKRNQARRLDKRKRPDDGFGYLQPNPAARSQ